MSLSHYVYDQADPIRLDQYLCQQGIATSRSQGARWIRNGWISINGKVAKASDKLKQGDQVDTRIDETPRPSTLEGEEIPLQVLYEDEDILVINKSADMVVHPGAGHWTGTLTHALLAYCKGLSTIGGVERPGIVHRLDKGTSGVMVIAKNDKTHIELSRQFKDHEVEKIYWALVYGRLKQKKGTIKSRIARSPNHRKKFAVSEDKGKDSVTHYEILNEGEGFSLVQLRLETGRTHQIRVHLTDIGHSIVGDPLYGGHSRRLRSIAKPHFKSLIAPLEHPLLHARSLQLTHPRTGKAMAWTAELPEDFQTINQALYG